MSIFIENAQADLDVDLKELRRWAQLMLERLDYAEFTLSIRLVTNNEIQQINCDFRDKDKPTDILSFPFYPDLIAGDRIVLQEGDEAELGDIAISVARVLADAKDLGVTFEQRLQRLLAHGIAHLLGHDHQTDTEYEFMKPVEDDLLACLK